MIPSSLLLLLSCQAPARLPAQPDSGTEPLDSGDGGDVGDGGGGRDGGGLGDGGDGGGSGDGGTEDGGTEDGGGSTTKAALPNILLVISDDLGVDASACYEAPVSTRAPQPTIEALCARGLVFDSAWSQPTCSPTRASLLTGRYPYRHGVAEPLADHLPGLTLDERLIPAVLDAAGSGYAHAAFGKWHLGTDANGGLSHPTLAGFSSFVGTWGGGVSSYRSWERVQDGVVTPVEGYLTSQTVDDALSWIGAQTSPWFALVGFHAAHSPIHLPPEELHSYELSGEAEDIAARGPAYFQSMIEEMDTELGRLLEGLPPGALDSTVVIYLADNGTVSELNSGTWPLGHGKSSVYLGGVLVPLIVAGPDIVEPGRRVSGLVDVVDLFPTILELAGLSSEDWHDEELPIDGISLVPALLDPAVLPTRTFQLAEWLPSNTEWVGTGRTISDGRFKLMRYRDGSRALYDIRVDPMELSPLDLETLEAEASAALTGLEAELDRRPLPD